MTGIGAIATSLLTAGAVAAGGLLGTDSSERAEPAPQAALVIDAAAARDGRDLVDARLRASDAELRLPRTRAEAVTNVRYFAAQDRRVVVAGPRALAAADAAGIPAVRATDVEAALRALPD